MVALAPGASVPVRLSSPAALADVAKRMPGVSVLASAQRTGATPVFLTLRRSLKSGGFSVQRRRHPRDSSKGLPGPLDVAGRVLVAVQDEAAVPADVGTHREALVDACPTA